MAEGLAATIEEANTELIADGKLDAAAEYFTADYVAHVTDRDLEGGPAGVRGFLNQLSRAFSDLEVEVDILLEGEDRVAWQRTVRGRHTGNFHGFPATDREIVWRDMLTSRFENGKIAEEWVVSDLAERLLLARK
jgi:steroid delta-isomerase-like uncharacterized protein